jgi:peptidoglycan-associated lipoprotein
MMHRLTVTALIAVLVATAGTACRRAQPEAPAPATVTDDDAARRAAEEARLREEEARRRAEEERLRAESEAARAILEERIHFDYDRSNLRPDSEQRLMRKVAVLRANPEARLRIEGHADERGSIEYNLALGQRRAETTRNFLAGFGIGAERLETVSFGEDRPLVRASNEEAWAQNRRAEFRIIAGGDRLRNPAP